MEYERPAIESRQAVEGLLLDWLPGHGGGGGRGSV
jgi:hypothetical protein